MPRPTTSSTGSPTTSPASSSTPCCRRSSRDPSAPCSRPTRPTSPNPIAAILADVDRLVIPNATHWQHPGFMAYFASTASGPGLLGEFLTAALGQNPMLWRTSPIGTELETVVVGWLREALGLPATFGGLLTDTASTSSLIALASAREASGLDAAASGLAARGHEGAPRVYASTEAHSSIDKACMTLGLGRASVVKIPVNETYEMDAEALSAAIEADHLAGRRPVAIVATIGTTSSTSADPVNAIADVATREGLWLHVDAAYAGVVALLPERRTPFVGLGPRGLDRRQPAQVAVHAARRVAAADPSHGPGARGVQPRARVPAHARPRLARARLQRVPAAARPADAGAQAVDADPVVRARRAATPDRLPPRARGSVRRLGRRGPRVGAARAGAVLDRLLPLPADLARGTRGRGRRARPARRRQHPR